MDLVIPAEQATSRQLLFDIRRIVLALTDRTDHMAEQIDHLNQSVQTEMAQGAAKDATIADLVAQLAAAQQARVAAEDATAAAIAGESQAKADLATAQADLATALNAAEAAADTLDSNDPPAQPQPEPTPEPTPEPPAEPTEPVNP